MDTSDLDEQVLSSIFTACTNMRLKGAQIESYIELIVGFQGNVFSSNATVKHELTKACLNTVGTSSSNKVGTKVESVFLGSKHNLAKK